MEKKSCLILAGEKSGEEHCLTFYSELSHKLPNVEYFGVGGDDLQNRGMELIYHLKDFSSMGFSEVIGKIPFYFKALKRIESEVETRHCQNAILVDFQDFNMRLAKRLAKKGVNVLYYVAPQAWAWRPGRANIIKKAVHTLFCILPFEKDWFQRRGVERVISLPHPLLRSLSADKILKKKNRTYEEVSNDLRLVLLPGSRNAEVKLLLPEFIETIRTLRKTRKVHVSLVQSGNVSKELFSSFEKEIDKIYSDKNIEEALLDSDLAVATSGTVTLTTGIYKVPTIVCYKTSLFNEFVFNTFINYPGAISLTNIIHKQMVFPELTQNEVSSFNISNALNFWLENKEKYNEVVDLVSQTKGLVSGETLDVADYMAGVIGGNE